MTRPVAASPLPFKQMAKVLRFAPVAVDDTLGGDIARHALAVPLGIPNGSTEPADVLMGIASLVYRRRKLINRLHREGYLPLAEWLPYAFAMNCPPVGAKISHKGLKPCRRAHFCPFCWVRKYAIEPFNRLCSYIYEDAAENRLRFDAWKLAEIYYHEDHPRTTPLSQLFDSLRTQRRGLGRSKLPGIRNVLRARYAVRADAAYSLSCISPVGRKWRVSCRLLLVAAGDYSHLPKHDTGNRGDASYCLRSVVRDHLDYAMIAEAVGHVAAYPPAFLRSRTANVVSILNAMPPKWRASEYFGKLRKPSGESY